MFTDETLDCVDCPSTWKKEAMVTDGETQTGSYTVIHRGVQIKRRAITGTQTEDFLYVEEDIHVDFDDSTELTAHVKRIEALMCDQLEKNAKSRAFESMHKWNRGAADVTLKHTLTNPQTVEEKFNITGLSWNSNGTVLAVAYGRYDHQDWCIHPSCLALWNVAKLTDPTSSKADFTFDVNSCLMCVQFHPVVPSLILGGTFTGEVIVWDLSNETDNLLTSSSLGEFGHNEPISQAVWMEEGLTRGQRHTYRLVTVGMDGKILLWTLNQRKASLTLTHGFMVRAEDLPRSVRVKGKRRNAVALTCAALSPHEPDSLLVGSDSGVILACSLTVPGHDDVTFDPALTLRSPVTLSFPTGGGGVHAIDWCRQHRNLFLSAGASGCVLVHSLLMPGAPLLSLEPARGYLYAVKMSSGRALLAAGAESGHVVLYDLARETGRAVPVEELREGEEREGVQRDVAPIMALEMSRKNPSLLAAGDSQGRVFVWNLSEGLVSGGENADLEALNQLASTAVE